MNDREKAKVDHEALKDQFAMAGAKDPERLAKYLGQERQAVKETKPAKKQKK